MTKSTSRAASGLALPVTLDEEVMFIELDRQRVASLADRADAPHRHDYQEIIWISAGSADHLLDGASVRVPAPSLLVIPQGRIHRFAPAPRLAGCVVRFRESFLPGASPILFNHFVGYSSIPVPEEVIAGLNALLAVIRGETRAGDPYADATLRHLLRALIAKIEMLWLRLLELQPQELTESQRLWERFTRLVEEKYRVEHSAGGYAGAIGVSLRRLNAVARLFAGVTVLEAIDRRLMLEARRLLLFTADGVGEISFALGFEEHSYFTRVFRKRFGVTPTQFRASNRPAETESSGIRKVPAFHPDVLP